MSTAARVGIATTVLTFLAGVWVFLSPFIVEFQEVGQDWIEATENNLWTGGALIAVSLLTLVLFSAFGLRDASNRAKQRQRERTANRGD